MTAAIAEATLPHGLDALGVVAHRDLDRSWRRRSAERRYVVRGDQLDELLAELGGELRVVERRGLVVRRFEAIHYDTHDLAVYRRHAAGRRHRQQIRSRRSLDDGSATFELKLDAGRAGTTKHRISGYDEWHGAMSPEAVRLVDEHRDRRCDMPTGDSLGSVLALRSDRIVVADLEAPVLITIDTGLTFRGADGNPSAAIRADLAVVDVESSQRVTRVDATLRRAGITPGPFNRYCLGMNLVRGGLPNNRFRRSLVEHFGWARPGEEVPR